MYKNLPKFDDNSYAHFITTKTYHHYPYFRDEELCQIMVEELKFYSRKYGFDLIGYVIMPDHLHLLVWWDKEEKPRLSISAIMRGIKGATAKRIIDLIQGKGLERMLQSTRRSADSKSHRQSLKYRLWQPGCYDFDIYSETKLLEKLDYMHNNPITAGLVSSSECYKWSSWRLYSLEKVQR